MDRAQVRGRGMDLHGSTVAKPLVPTSLASKSQCKVQYIHNG